MRYTADLNTLPDVRFLNRFSPQGEWTHFRRRSGEFILYYLVDGAMYLREEGESYSLRAGDVILLQPGLLHEGFKAAPCDYYFVHFSGISLLPEQERGEALGGYREGKSEAERCVIPKVSHIEGQEMRTRLNECFEEAILAAREGRQNHRVLWACKLLEVLMTVSQNSLRADLAKWNARLPAKTVHRLDSLTDYLHTHYREKITAKQLESVVGMNFDYLNRTFRRLNGQSIFRYLTEVRINRAKELLATTDMKIWEIAWETGFSDQFYFSRQFKKYTGISPALFAGSRSG